MKKILLILFAVLTVSVIGQQSFKNIKVNSATQTINMALSDGDEVVNIDGDTTWRITAYVYGGGTLADITTKVQVGAGTGSSAWTAGDGTNTIYQNGIDPGKTTENNLIIFDRAKHVNPFSVTSAFVDFYSTWRSPDSILTATPMRYKSMAELKADTNRPVIALLSGYYTENDGGGGYFLLDTASTDTDNGGTIIKQDDYTNGRYLRFLQDGYYPEQFGFIHDDNTEADNNARIIDSVMADLNIIIRFYADDYYVGLMDFRGKEVSLIGYESPAGRANAYKTVLRFIGSERDTTFAIFGSETITKTNLSASKGVYIKDIEFYSGYKTSMVERGIWLRGVENSILDNVAITFFKTGIKTDYTWSNRFKDVLIDNAADTAVSIGNWITDRGGNGDIWDGLKITGSDSLLCAISTKRFNTIIFNTPIIDVPRKYTFTINPLHFSALTILNPHFEDSTSTYFYIDNSAPDSTSTPKGSIFSYGGKYRHTKLYRNRDNTYDSAKMFSYVSATDSNSVANIVIQSVLNSSAAPRLMASDLFDASNILRLDISYMTSDRLIDSVIPQIINKGLRVPLVSKPDGWWLSKDNMPLINSISAADTVIDDGTATGQMNYWDGSKWTYAATSDLFWDNSNGFLGLGDENTTVPLSIKTANDTIYKFMDAAGVIRSVLRNGGYAQWRVGTAGSIEYSTPGGTPGIIFWDASDVSRSQIKLVAGGGITMGSVSGSTIPGNDFNFTNAGYLGIGTASPSAELDVNGDAEISGTLDIAGDFTSQSITDDGTTVEITSPVNITGNLEVTGTITPTAATHLFYYYGDSAISLSYTTAWTHLTNSRTGGMWIHAEDDGFTVSNDTITVSKAGDYDFFATNLCANDLNELLAVRFYNVTQATPMPVAGAVTGEGTGDVQTVVTSCYFDCDLGDKIVLQYRGDANGTVVFNAGVIKIYKIHN